VAIGVVVTTHLLGRVAGLRKAWWKALGRTGQDGQLVTPGEILEHEVATGFES
jgi:hypothetical protein